ncbi:hypothetical protein [Gymnodinialimonas sp.]
MLIRSILTLAVLASFVFGAAANADTPRVASNLTAQVDGITSPGDVPLNVAPSGTPWSR